MSENDAPPPTVSRVAPATGEDGAEFLAADVAGTHPASSGAAPPAASALPQRIRRVPAPTVQSRTGPSPVGIEILRRVIDGLNRL